MVSAVDSTQTGKRLLDKVSDKSKKIAAIVSSAVVLISAVTGICSWVSAQFQAAVSAQIDDLKIEVQNNHAQTELQVTRLELMTLMNSQPGNVAEIEKVARYYFVTLKGDWFLTSLYSQWCQEYGGDLNIAVGEL